MALSTNKPLEAGFYSAILTPFSADGQAVDHDALAHLVAYNMAQGVKGIYAGGSTAEAFMMSDDERIATFETVSGVANGATLIAHVGAISLMAAQRMAREAARLGFDAISAIPPFYFRFSFDEICGYYEELAKTVDLPFVIYNFPALSGVKFSRDQLAKLLALPNVVGIKHTDSDTYAIERLRADFPDLLVFNGYDETMLAGLAMGASGGVGTTYNIQGYKFVALKQHFDGNRLEEARALQHDINALIDETLQWGVFRSVKYLLELKGLAMGPCRPPFAPLAEEGKKQLERLAGNLLQETIG